MKNLLSYIAAMPLKRLGNFILSRTNLTTWAKLHTNQMLKVDLSSSVGRSIFLRGKYEPEVEKIIRSFLYPGDTFVDVGANVGYFSIIASALVGHKGEIHSFEPHLRANQLLKASAKKNATDNIFVNQKGLWSSTCVLSFDSKQNSAFSSVKTEQSASSAPITTIMAITLDEYVKNHRLSDIKLVKIDVEGAEYQVLMGMPYVLREIRPCLIIELQDWSLAGFGNNIVDLFTLLESVGYSAYDLQGNTIKDVDEAEKVLQRSWIKNLVFQWNTHGINKTY